MRGLWEGNQGQVENEFYSLIYLLFTFKMEQLAETNRLLELILVELKTSNEISRKAATNSVTIGESIMEMIKKWAWWQGSALRTGDAVYL